MSAVEDYEEYLRRYCIKHHVSKEEAETHALVKQVKHYYDLDDNSVKTVGWKENET